MYIVCWTWYFLEWCAIKQYTKHYASPILTLICPTPPQAHCRSHSICRTFRSFRRWCLLVMEQAHELISPYMHIARLQPAVCLFFIVWNRKKPRQTDASNFKQKLTDIVPNYWRQHARVNQAIRANGSAFDGQAKIQSIYHGYAVCPISTISSSIFFLHFISSYRLNWNPFLAYI